jgi:hypothetical protein
MIQDNENPPYRGGAITPREQPPNDLSDATGGTAIYRRDEEGRITVLSSNANEGWEFRTSAYTITLAPLQPQTPGVHLGRGAVMGRPIAQYDLDAYELWKAGEVPPQEIERAWIQACNAEGRRLANYHESFGKMISNQRKREGRGGKK